MASKSPKPEKRPPRDAPRSDAFRTAPLAAWSRSGAWRVRREPSSRVSAAGEVATTGVRVAVEEREAIRRLTALLELASGVRGSHLVTVRALVGFALVREEEFVAFALGP